MYRIALSAISMALAGIFVASPARAADSARAPASDALVYQQTVEKGIDYLIHKGNSPMARMAKKGPASRQSARRRCLSTAARPTIRRSPRA